MGFWSESLPVDMQIPEITIPVLPASVNTSSFWDNSQPVASNKQQDQLKTDKPPTVGDADWDGVNEPTKKSVMGLIQYMRQVHGYDPEITSGYRDPERNAKAGGVPDSRHIQRDAVDLDLSGLSEQQRQDVMGFANNNFEKVLYHDAGSGLHLHVERPMTKILDAVAQVFKPGVAEAAPAQAGSGFWGPAQQIAPKSGEKANFWGNAVADEKNLPVDMQLPGYGNENIRPEKPLLDVVSEYAQQPLKVISTIAEEIDKPRGALTAAAWNLGRNDPKETVMQALQRGWKENDSNITELAKSGANKPLDMALGLAMDIALDPAWLLTPAKAVSLASDVLKGLGLLDKVVDASKAATAIDGAIKAKEIGSAFVPAKEALQVAVESGNAEKITTALSDMNNVMKLYGITDGVKAVLNPTDYKYVGPIADVATAVKDSKVGQVVSAAVNAPIAGGLSVKDWVSLPPAAFNDLMDARAQGIAKDAIASRQLMNEIGTEKKAFIDELIAGGMDKAEAAKQGEDFTRLITQYVKAPNEAAVNAVSLARGAQKDIIRQAAEKYGLDEVDKSILASARANKMSLSDYQADLIAKRQEMLDAASRNGQHAEAAFSLANVAPEFQQNEERLKQITALLNKQGAKELEKEWSKSVKAQLLEEIPQRAQEARPALIEAAKTAGWTDVQAGKVAELGDKVASLSEQYTHKLHSMGLISDHDLEMYAEGSHLRRDYSRHVTPEAFLKLLEESGAAPGDVEKARALVIQQASQKTGTAKENLKLDNLIQRLKIPRAVQERMGVIHDAQYLIGRTSQISSDLIHTNTMLDRIAQKYGRDSTISIPTKDLGKWKVIPNTPEWGALAGKYVPAAIDAALQSEFRTPSPYSKALGLWKSGKTVLNPATHVRNALSNMILLNVAGVPSHRLPDVMARAVKERATGGAAWREFEPYVTGSFTKAELQGLMQNKEGGLSSKIIDPIKGGIQKASDIYQENENIGKLAAFIYAKEQGKTIVEAAKFANDALFNYSRVPPIVDMLRRSGIVPFASFPYFATKATVKGLYESPATVTKYYKVASLGNKNEQDLFPEYMKPYSFIPVGKGMRTVNGEQQPVSRYLDVSYINPFESDLNISPLFGIATVVSLGIDPFTKRPVEKDPDTKAQAMARAKYVAGAIGPAAAGNVEKIYNAIQGNMDKKGRVYNPYEAISTALGIKIVPINVDESYKNNFLDFKNKIDESKAKMKDIMRDKSMTQGERQKQIKVLQQNISAYQQNIQFLSNVHDKVVNESLGK